MCNAQNLLKLSFGDGEWILSSSRSTLGGCLTINLKGYDTKFALIAFSASKYCRRHVNDWLPTSTYYILRSPIKHSKIKAHWVVKAVTIGIDTAASPTCIVISLIRIENWLISPHLSWTCRTRFIDAKIGSNASPTANRSFTWNTITFLCEVAASTDGIENRVYQMDG